MSTQAKKSKKNIVPEIYVGLVQDTKLTKQCIVEDTHGKFFRWNIPQECHIVKDAIHKTWPTFTQFADENKQTLLTYHENLFKAPAPAEQDLTQTALMCWYKMCSIAEDRTVKPGSEGKVTDPATGRKSTIGTRKYFRRLSEDGKPVPCVLKTPQAQACLKIFEETLEAQGTPDKEMTKDQKEIDIKSLTEAILKAEVYKRAAELKTRQDAWRIFQYYRPQLISCGCIRHD